MKNYEIMFIVKPTLGEEEVKAVATKFQTIVTENGGTVTSLKELGQKELAYEIKNFKSGFYFVMTIKADNDKAVSEFDRLALISSDVIRHLITNLEK